MEKKSKLKPISHDSSESKVDHNSIDCEASALDAKRDCHNLLIYKATMRNMSMISFGYESTRAELKMHINRKHHVKNLKNP